MDKQIEKILRKQLKLLAERSKGTGKDDLCSLTHAMVSIAFELSRYSDYPTTTEASQAVPGSRVIE